MRPGAPSESGADTIAAIATAPGAGAIGVIRVSGPAALECASPLVRLAGGRDLAAARPRVLHRAQILDPLTGAQIDDALVVVMLGPHSYTGEDVVEISCHGSPVLLAAIVVHLVKAGARLAAPGEFTRRAYLNGRLDLVQAEAVAVLIGARSERAARLAARQIGGALSQAIRAVREGMLDVAAGLEVSLDFPEDEVGLSPAGAAARCGEMAKELGRLGAGARQGRVVHDGLTVMLAGAPNVGKSSLLNALLGQERAIVSPHPGTTRDLVDGGLVLEEVFVRITDGAGIGVPRDAIDAEGMRRSRRGLAESDLVLLVLDRSRPLSDDDREVLQLTEGGERLIVGNKSDLPPAWTDAVVDCTCSSLSGSGVAEVRSRLEAWVKSRGAADGDEGGIVASLRAIDQIEQAHGAIERAAVGLARNLPLETVLVDVRGAVIALDRILGLDTDDAVLDRIFSAFCIGK